MLSLLSSIPESSPQPDTVDPYVPTRPIEPGEFVYVYDGHKDKYLWQLVVEVRIENDRQKIRVDGTVFFFDEALVIAVAYLTGGGI